jgi:hypothetical protein
MIIVIAPDDIYDFLTEKIESLVRYQQKGRKSEYAQLALQLEPLAEKPEFLERNRSEIKELGLTQPPASTFPGQSGDHLLPASSQPFEKGESLFVGCGPLFFWTRREHTAFRQQVPALGVSNFERIPPSKIDG